MTTTIGSSGATVSQTLLDTMNGTNNATSATGSSSSSSGTSAADLQNTFLQLLVAQLKNQDPTSPMDSSQMTSQLAEISTVQGISQLNTSLTSLSTQLAAGQSSQAALLIGSSVLASGSTMTVSSGKASTIGVQLPAAADDVTLTIKNSSGTVVNTIDLGKQAAGVTPVGVTAVDSSGNTLADGTYTFTVSATAGGQPATATALSAATVESVVQQSDGTSGLVLSNGSTVPLTGINAIL
ncbi:flagellar basal-body rod modification protein FlgD [Paraburkholderia fungorum]|uniref:Basal-body rod modification protein FlgD n=1 Tax=Paraburkholderia fungorum TaxID=134537 RepID=A0A1H0YKA4_9BURK|nr:flagellar hook assembly protein FlgD [Paraburkholderia fungorum]SDQ15450.1 flagellar basal-body rod modification protein FlgD [Paraburkholderia fungorum]